jgi:hypothetical protein
MEIFLEFRLHLIFNQFVVPLLLCIGTFGNIITIVVLTQAKHRKFSTARLMLALAITDLMNLWLVIPVIWVDAVFSYDINNSPSLLCKTHKALAYFIGQASILYVVALNIERFIRIRYPHKSNIYCSLRNANIAIGVTPIITFGLLFHVLYRMSTATKGDCSGENDIYKEWVWRVWQLLNIFTMSFASFAILLTINMFIFTKFAIHNCRRCMGNSDVQENDKRGNAYRGKMSQITVTLSLVTGTFFICVFPIMIYSLMYKGGHRPQGNSHEDAKILLFNTLATGCMLITNVINFFIYFLSGTKFRKEVKLLLCKKKNRVHPV